MAGVVLAVLAVGLLAGFALMQRRRHAQERAKTAGHRTENKAFGLSNDAPAAANGQTATVPPMHGPAIGLEGHVPGAEGIYLSPDPASPCSCIDCGAV